MIKKIINLLKVKKSISGRGAKGNLVCYSKGGASSKRFYRLINFINDFLNIPCVILSLQKDPNRTALIMLICYKNGYLSYNIAFKHSEVGGILFFSCNKFLYSKGDSILLKFLTLGSTVYNIFNNTNKKIYIRAGGSYGKIITHKQNFSLLELKSGEYKLFNNNNLINAGSVFLKTDSSKNKAGKSRRLS
jgi:large subunit ribosomal protein L2